MPRVERSPFLLLTIFLLSLTFILLPSFVTMVYSVSTLLLRTPESIISCSALLASSGTISFLKSPLARRMAAAAGEGKLYKERQFVMGVTAHRIGGEYHGDELILVQGIIDAYFDKTKYYSKI